MRFLPAKDPAEDIVLEYDYTNDLGAETLIGVPTGSVSVYMGTDANASQVLNGDPVIDTTAKKILVPVKDGLSGCTYAIKVVCATTNPLLVLSITGYLPVREGA